MKKLVSNSRALPWFMAVLLSALVTACGGGSGGQTPILGSGGAQAAPMVSAVAPAPNATAVPVNTRIVTATFTKAMDPTTLTASSFTLACAGGAPITGGVVTYAAAGNMASLTFPVASSLPPSTLCTGTVTAAAKDTAGIAMLTSFVWSFTTGVIPDTTAPTVTNTINANGAVNVAINTKVGATFSEAMTPSTLNGTTFTLKQGLTPVAGTLSYVGVSAVFAPTTPLAFSTLYTVTVKGGVGGAADLAGNVMASDYVWSWTTGIAPDTTPPTVTGTINANGATGVAINTKAGATFSEGMDPLTVTTANFLLKEFVSGNAVAGTVSYSGVSAVFTPMVNLAYNTRYTATVKGSPTGVSDLAGNQMVSDYVWSWTTGAAPDTTAPTVTGTINANGATGVAINTKAGATFSEGMDPLTVTTANFLLKEFVSGNAVAGTVSYSGVSAVFTPMVNLAYNTRYTVTIKGSPTGVSDLAGNQMVSDYVWSWTTGAAPDTTAPTVIGTIHTNGQTGVAVNTNVGATFSEAMDPLTVTNINFSLKQTNNGLAVAGTVNYSGVNALFNPTSNLAFSTQYTVTVKGGASGVADLAGNRMMNDFVISWTTGAAPDTTAPTVTLVAPANLAINVPLNSSVNATFSEAMNPLKINTASFSVAGAPGLVTYNAGTRVATLVPTSLLTANTTYTATVTTATTDLAGNALAVNKVWSFTTAAAVVPPIVLASAAPFGTFGGTAGMTNTGIQTVVNGDIGTISTNTVDVTGFHDTGANVYTETPSNIGSVNGTIYTCTTPTTPAGVDAAKCAIATQARLDAQTAYLALVAKPVGGASPAPGANMAGITLLPGVYTAPSGSFMIQGGDLTLDAQGDANAVWVFQMATTLTVGGPGAAFPQSIILAGGALPKNVYWQVGSFATINAGGGGTMVGTIISQAGVSFSTAGNVAIVTLNGRALSLGASVTLVNTVINVPAP